MPEFVKSLVAIDAAVETHPDRRRRARGRAGDGHRRRLAPLASRPDDEGHHIDEAAWDEARLLDPEFDAPDDGLFDGFRSHLRDDADEWDRY